MNNFVKKIFGKPRTSFIMGIILGMVFMASGVYAAQTFTSKNVFYDKSSSNLSSTNVQDALDELYENAKSCFPHYAFGLPTDSSPTNFKDVIASSGSNIFVRKLGNQLSVCAYSTYTNNKLVCLKHGTANFEETKALLSTTNFPGTNCNSTSNGAACISDDYDFICEVYDSGVVVDCYAGDELDGCRIYDDGSVSC